MRNKKVNLDVLINWWLGRYFKTNLKKVFKENPNYHEDNYKFYLDYAVTQEQHDEWEIWAKKYIKKITKLSKKFIDRGWSWLYLNTSPNIKEKKEN